MREMQNGASGRLVNAAAFHSDEAIFHNVHAADSVFSAELVQGFYHAERREFFFIHADAIAVLEDKFDIFRFVRRIFRRDA